MTDNQATPRFPGFREMGAMEIIEGGDMRTLGGNQLIPASYIGHQVGYAGAGIYFRPIAPAAAPKAEPKMLSQIPRDELFALHRACLNLDATPTVSKTETTTEPKAAPEGAGTAPAREIQDLDRLERLLLDQGFRMDPEISYIRKALAERATLTAALAKAREALEFYATGTNWLSEGWQTSPAVHDHGKTARAALGNLEQKGGGL